MPEAGRAPSLNAAASASPPSPRLPQRQLQRLRSSNAAVELSAGLDAVPTLAEQARGNGLDVRIVQTGDITRCRKHWARPRTELFRRP